MKAPTTRLSLAAIAISAFFATPVAAATVEEAVVPPSNSAATQYTETFPTSGGNKKTDQKPSHRSPAKVLGTRNTQKLEKQGPEGKAAAEAAAATAPTTISTPQPAHGPFTQGKGSERSGNGSGGASIPPHGSGAASGGETARPPASEPTGSSGIGAAIGQATGISSADQSGPLLPLVILATVLWALAYLRRQRRQVG